MLSRAEGPPADERGSGLLSTSFGFAAFLGFVLFASHLALGLSARSQAGALAFDATRRLAAAGPGCGADGGVAIHDGLVRSLQGRWRDVAVDLDCAPDAVTVRVSAERPVGLLPSPVRRALRAADLHRTYVVRTEGLR